MVRALIQASRAWFIPTELGLTKVEELFLTGTTVGGTDAAALPKEIFTPFLQKFSLQHGYQVELHSGRMSGTLPPEIENSPLVELVISGCYATGTIPRQLFSMRNLMKL